MTDTVGFVLGELETPPTPRNAAAADGTPFYQWKLRQQIAALKEAYGWRQDYEAPNYRAVPYLPAPFAEEMLRYIRAQAKHWLGTSIPRHAKQPGFIKRWRDEATSILGAVVGEKLVINPANFEDAPTEVAAKAPSYYASDTPAGRPSSLTVETWESSGK